MESMSSVVHQQRMEVEQLRREAALKRILVSQAIEDIKRFAMDHMTHDHLIIGFASEKANPFREKTWSCDLL
uniref:Guanine nucleotide-binding protein subunit gamma-1 n=1 Tax=Lepeophtheirus salmonis TaxID=72036 RepID=D3PHE7_LEPSM|nr:Guanine nucleotide-binding protein subunit gamma-1 [Lepeophtheirus salmonis]